MRFLTPAAVPARPSEASVDDVAPALEQLPPSFHLRVLRILDLQPGRTPPVTLIRAVRPLRDNAFEIPPACEPE